MILNRRGQIEKTRKIMDWIVYFSSFVDVLIAILVTLSYFKVGDPGIFLPSVESILTVTVVLTVVMGVLLVYLKHYESILAGFFHVQSRVKTNLSRFQRLLGALSEIKTKYRYRYKPRV